MTAIANTGRGPHIDAVIERILEQLPDAPASSFAHPVEWAEASAWPLDPERLFKWEALRSEFDSDDESSRTSLPEFQDQRELAPASAHLADFNGDVVRILSLLEVHVHDRKRLLAAAGAEGYPADPAEGEDAHVLDAIMLLADAGRTPPGTSSLENASDGSFLSAKLGDEIAEWSEVPVTADFGIGWRVSRARRGED